MDAARITQEIREIYNGQIAPTTDARSRGPARRYFVQRKIKCALEMGRFAPGTHLLEVGPWVGEYSFLLRERGFKITGLDLSDVAVARCRSWAASQKVTDVEFHLGDARKMPFQDGQFSGVVSFSAFRYIPEMPTALKEVHRVLKPGGTVVIDFPNRYCPWFRGTKQLFGQPTHVHDNHYTVAGLTQLFKSCGFREVSARRLLFTPYVIPGWMLPVFRAADLVLEPLPPANFFAAIIMVKGIK
jgi:ubiquinone/menaquinone biosynthesis C-methylase UbiE